MKIIPKFQQGGSYHHFFNVYRSSQRPPSPRQTQEGSRNSSDSDKGKLSEKDLFTLLKDTKDFLPSDSDALFASFSNLLRRAQNYGEDSLEDISTLYTSILQQLPHLQSSKSVWQDTFNKARDNGTLNDVAITTSGHVVATDKSSGEIVYLTPQEWVEGKHSGQYDRVTNNELLELRRENIAFAGKDGVFQVVGNGINLDTVHKLIKDRLDIGNTSHDSFMSRESIMGIDGSQLSQNEQAGLAALQMIVAYGPEGYYKHSTERASDEQIASALKYIYKTLPDNAKIRLQIEGDGTPNSVLTTIADLITGKLDTKDDYSYFGTKNGKGENGVEIGGEEDTDWTVAQRWLYGLGYNQMYTINFGDNNYVTVSGNTMPLTGKSDNNLKIGSSLKDASEGSYLGILNWDSITVGGLPVSSVTAGEMIIRNPNITMIDYPCIKENGKIRPIVDVETRKKKDQAEQKMRQEGINLDSVKSRKQNWRKINEIYEEFGIPPRYDENGKLNSDSWATFGLISVAMDEDSFPDMTNGVLQKLDGRDKQAIQSALKNNNKDINFDDDIYEGIAWIPVNASYNAAMASAKVKGGEALTFDIQDQARQTQQQQFETGRHPQM